MRRPVEQGPSRVRALLLLAEAVVYLLAARVALAIFPFRRLTGLFERSSRRPELTGDARLRARGEVCSAIRRVRHGSLVRTTCLHRAIAAQAMLRRRGVSTTLYYGAATLPEQGLTAHAWVQDGEAGVVGKIEALREQYHVLARYPKNM